MKTSYVTFIIQSNHDTRKSRNQTTLEPSTVENKQQRNVNERTEKNA